MAKLKLALYWAASCGGCEIAQLQIGDKILKLAEVADIVFWPVAIDAKYKDVEAMPAKSIDVCLFNGAIRNSEQEHLAKMLREKSKVMIAYGACAYEGGIPGLANLFNRQPGLFRNTVYGEQGKGSAPDKI
jgi:F420-non-reducing hydrogenase small subunit